MTRSLGSASTEAAKKLGTEPIFIIEVDWGSKSNPSSPTLSYADKTIGGVPGKILDVSDLDAIIKLGTTGSTAELSITLDDTDNSIKAILNTNDIHKSEVRVYQTYASLTVNEKFLLFAGVIETPIIYSDAERSISFDVVVKIEDKEIGFSPEEGEFGFIAPEAIGVPWPLCFGSVIRVPAVKLTEQVRGTSLTNYGAVSLGDLDNLCARAFTLHDVTIEKEAADINPGFSDDNYAIVVDNVTSATISMNILFEALIADSPNQERDLLSFISVCVELRKNIRNLELFRPQQVPLPAQIAALEGDPGTAEIPIGGPGNPFPHPRVINPQTGDPIGEDPIPAVPPSPGSIEEKKAQLLAEQAVNQQSPSTASILLIESLQEELDVLILELSDLKILNSFFLLQITVANVNIGIFTGRRSELEARLSQIIVNPIFIENGEAFPQDVPVKIIINGLVFRGTFTGRKFDVLEANLPADTGVALGGRQNSNANEFWVADPTVDLKGKYCKFPSGVLFVDNQDQTRCFASPILYQQTGVLPTIEGLLINGEPVTREVFKAILLTQTIQETSVYLRPSWFVGFTTPDFANGRSNLTKQDYSISVGDEVFLDTDFQDIYIANLIPSTEVKEVMAFRTISGVRRLVPLPSRYYIVTLSEAIAGQTSTTIRFRRPLSAYVGENWEEEIFVTLISTVGPNTADIISFIATTYTELTPDSSTFSLVAGAIDAYPSHFPILTRPSALSVMEEIAWQARCTVFVKSSDLFIKYLAVEEAAVATITVSEIQKQTLEMMMSETEDLVTKFVAEWKFDHAIEKPNKVILRNNITRYGKIEQVFDFFIYNVEQLVVKSATFWMLRYSNTWKMVKFSGFLDRLELETLDTVLLILPSQFISTDLDVKGIVHKAILDSVNQLVEYEIWTPIRAGEMEQYVFAWPANSPIGKEYPTDDDPFAGGAN